MITVEPFSIPIEKSFHPLGALKVNVQDDVFDNGQCFLIHFEAELNFRHIN